MQIETILSKYGIDSSIFAIDKIGSGYINATYKISSAKSYILQRVNKNVFKQPEVIADNLRVASDHLKSNHPDYLFLSPVKTLNGDEMAYDVEGFPWRLFPYIEHSVTIDEVTREDEAREAAGAFARMTLNLDGANVNLFKPTIDRFHDLHWRFEQFEFALANASKDRMDEAGDVIEKCLAFKNIVVEYNRLMMSDSLPVRITHNDTKINNVLFDSVSRKAICVIDLDTLMPGYFIYDVGDMIRTFVSPANEEEQDLSKVVFRKPIYDALVSAYYEQMDGKLTEIEKTLFPFAGLMMTYIMALRMITDFLAGDVYYQITYPKQNLVRARNQIRLLEVLNSQSY